MLDILSRIGGVIGKLQLHLYTVELAGELKQQGNAGAGKLDVPLNREELFRNAMNLLHEAVKLSENEELAAKAKARMQAMHLATQASFAAECILRDYQRDDIIAVVNEVVKTNECLKEELRKLRERAEEATPASQ